MRRKNIADIMLLASFVVFAAAFWAHKSQPHSFLIGLIYMAAEAALVGGVADWFAVTALFRRPLGFPWHTALVPRNRERIITALTGAVENEFLSIDTLKQHLEQARLTGLLIQWVDAFGGEKIIIGAINTCYRAVQDQDARVWAPRMEGYLQELLKSRDPLPLLRRGIQYLLAAEQTAPIANSLLERARNTVVSPEFRIRLEQRLTSYQHRAELNWWERAVFWLGKRTNAVNMGDAAAVLQNELAGLLKDLQDYEHPLRRWFVEQLVNFSAPQPAGGETLRRWWRELAEDLNLVGFIQEVFDGVRQAALKSLAVQDKGLSASPDSMLRLWLIHQLTAFWQRFRTDSSLQEWVDERLRLVVYHVIETEHHLIGDVVRSALAKLDDDALNEFILARAGNDLQWIRINGSLVGGAVGALMYLFLHFLYQPHILPLLNSLRH